MKKTISLLMAMLFVCSVCFASAPKPPVDDQAKRDLRLSDFKRLPAQGCVGEASSAAPILDSKGVNYGVVDPVTGEWYEGCSGPNIGNLVYEPYPYDPKYRIGVMKNPDAYFACREPRYRACQCEFSAQGSYPRPDQKAEGCSKLSAMTAEQQAEGAKWVAAYKKSVGR